MDVLATLQSLYPTFTKVEKKIADFFLEEQDGHYFPSATLDSISKAIGVGQASIVRLIKKCGYGSYRSFIVDLGREQYISSITTRVSHRQSGSSLCGELTSALKTCGENLPRERVHLVAECMTRADMVVCVGYGVSALVANIAALRLRHEGILAVQGIPGEADCFNSPKHQKLRTVVFTFSASGETPETLHSIQGYVENGACIVAFTNHVESTLAKLSNVTFFAPSNSSNSGHRRDLDGIFTQLYIVEVLLEEYLVIFNNLEQYGGNTQ